MILSNSVPYCGSPPAPGSVAWNVDPVLWSLLAVGAAAYFIACRRLRRGAPARHEQICFALGWTILALALISPICNLSVALFSARVGQHMILSLIAAPLLVLGRADLLILRALGIRSDTPARTEAYAAPLAFAFALWVWHAPGPYDATFASHVVYWTMHVTLFAAAIALWRVLLRGVTHQPVSALLASAFTGAQMCALGVLLTFASHPLFSVHAATTWAWGWTQVQDQQFGGLLMWVPGGMVFTLHALAVLGLFLSGLDRRARSA
ncbi:MAG: putative rane protein [Methylobacteriaceae bacterium]|nr:putative rane protein [Methylobacteriaceae bacterium]